MGCGFSVDFDDPLLDTYIRGAYIRNILGVYESFWDFRETEDNYVKQRRPKCEELEVWVDENYPQIRDAIYLRPQDICKEQRLYCKDPCTAEITQSELDTGYLLAVLDRLLKDHRYIKRILRDGCYSWGDPLTYDGVVCVTFWRFGRWENVFIDDRIPLEKISGARLLSYCHDKDELWLTYIEKAWIKFWGGVPNIEYGTFHDAHLHLTGGVQDVIYFDRTKLKPGDIYHRIKRGLKQGAHVACAVATKNDGVYGLTAGDTFIVLDAYQVITHKVLAKELHLLRINDPLGFTNWKGPWSKDSTDWNTLSSHNEIRHQTSDNDFIMAFRDFIAYMEYVCICSQTPVIAEEEDEDGSTRQKYCTHVYGEWLGDSAAGSIKILDNPKFIFTVSNKGNKREKEFLGVSLVQRTKSRTGDRAPIGVRLFKTKQYSQGLLIEEIGETFEKTAMQILRTVNVLPGKYIVIANTQSNGIEKDFLIRIYTSQPVYDVRQLGPEEAILLLKEDKPLTLRDLKCSFDVCQEIWGKWTKGFHGGCYLDNDFERNPQLDITVPDGDELKQTIRFKVLKDWNAEDASLGFRLFRVGVDDDVPKPTYWLYRNWEYSVRCRDGSIEGWEWDYLAPTFILEPGRYCGILYNEKRGGSDTAFCIMVMSATPLDIKTTEGILMKLGRDEVLKVPYK